MHFTTGKRHGNGAILPFLTVSWSYGPLLAWAACLLRPPDFGKVTMRIDRIWEFLQRLSPLTRSCLLTELERMEMCGIDMPGSADLQAKLRAELRPDGANDNTPTPSRYFFAPL